jgi:hypothetical protein
MKISYITRTMWAPARYEYIREAEECLAAQEFVDESEWIIVSEVPPPAGVLRGLVPTIHITDLDITYRLKNNRGIEQATGEYIAFMDDDNRKSPEFARMMMSFIEISVAAGAFCFANTIDAEGTWRGHHKVSGVDYAAAWHQGGFYHLEELMVRKDFLLDVGGFDEMLECAEDYDLALRLIKTGRIGLLPVMLVDMRFGHGDATSQAPENTGQRTQDALHRILAKHDRLNPTCPHCGRGFAGVPYSESHIQWTNPQNCFMRICHNGEATV